MEYQGELYGKVRGKFILLEINTEQVDKILKEEETEKHYSKSHHASFLEQGKIECLENQISLHKEQIEGWESWAKYVEKYMGADAFDEMQTEGHI